ncbi:cellulose biosynthesis protein BcsP [Paraburkholderia sp. RL17-337-BIB-A]|uniref:cellulose biosynthesis protein BcsP n=1 Tax=Paraburkholderia sp. RL17-337-BIB-A TaxID=3031636 RepID=UPI0038BDA243
MSSSSDIEKLFDHFGGDANAYQEIGRENEARAARTRWPLLVTLDLTQPTIPAIGQRREPPREPLAGNAQAAAVDRLDTTPKDAVSVTRARAPLFTRSHRRDIPPVIAAAAAQPAAPSGASRFGALEANADAEAQAAHSMQTAPAAARVDAAPPAATQAAPAVVVPQMSPAAAQVATAPVPPLMSRASVPPVAQSRTPAMPVTQPVTSMSPNAPPPRAEIPALTPRATAPTWAQAPAPVPAAAAPAWTQASSAHAQAHAPTYTTTPAAPKPPASILGKLFASEPELASPPQPAAPAGGSAPLQSVFDRLRGTPAQTAAAPAGAASATPAAGSNSWLVNGPRRS